MKNSCYLTNESKRQKQSAEQDEKKLPLHLIDKDSSMKSAEADIFLLRFLPTIH